MLRGIREARSVVRRTERQARGAEEGTGETLQTPEGVVGFSFTPQIASKYRFFFCERILAAARLSPVLELIAPKRSVPSLAPEELFKAFGVTQGDLNRLLCVFHAQVLGVLGKARVRPTLPFQLSLYRGLRPDRLGVEVRILGLDRLPEETRMRQRVPDVLQIFKEHAFGIVDPESFPSMEEA